MTTVGLVIEGAIDRIAGERILQSRGLVADPDRTIVTNGKVRFDARIASFNQAARFSPWFAIRDADQDGADCPVALRKLLLTRPQSAALCLRLAVRTIETWLLADRETFASHFDIAVAKVPRDPEQLKNPKNAVVAACRSSRRRDVREGAVPPAGAHGTGPEYTTLLGDYCRGAWRPDHAAITAPSLRRTLVEIDRLITAGVW